MSAKVEQVVYSSVSTQKTLRLLDRFELTHAPLSHSRRLVRQLGSIVRILRSIVNRLWNQFSMSNTITPQLIGHYFPRFAFMNSQQPLKEALCRPDITSFLEKHINYFTVLIIRSPQIVLLPLNLHKDLINEEGVAESLVISS